MVFLGHAALVHHGVAAISSFHPTERRAESTYMRRWLASQGFLLWDTPRETAFEGEGDLCFNDTGTALWAAHGVRTCKAAHRHVADAWHVPVESLHLVDPRFYHLDTCFTPLAGGYLLYYPGAFDAASLARIERFYSPDRRIAVSEADATRMACSALNLGRTVFTGEIGRELAGRLFDAGFDVVQLELGEFIMGGGGARSLALRLSDLPVTHGQLGQTV
jgi:ornithine--oxo-acid transaminase